MRGSSSRFYRDRTHRGLAAAVVLLALLMQAISPYLAMPAMGGATSWDLAAAALDPCPMHQTDAGDKAPAKSPQNGHCTVCTVLQQAGSTLAVADLALTWHLAYLRVERDETRDTQIAEIPAHTFSSRAPPHTA